MRPTFRILLVLIATVAFTSLNTQAQQTCCESSVGCDDGCTAGCANGCSTGCCDNGCTEGCANGCSNGGWFAPVVCAGYADDDSRDWRTCSWYRPYTERSQPDIFYNYYVPNNSGSTAAAFPAPYPTPSHVGHTYYTYQPLMPNEFLYQHHRSYRQYYNNGMGMNRARVVWYNNPVANILPRLHLKTVWR